MSQVALVVADAAALTADDTAIQGLLEDLGATVTPISDEDAAPGGGYDLVVIAESVNSLTVGTKYVDSTMPVVILEQALSDEFGLSLSTNNVTSATSVDILQPGHGAAAKLSGTVAIYASNQNIYHIPDTDIAPGAVGISVTTGLTSAQSLTVAEKGASLLGGGTAAARRVFWGTQPGAATSLTADGERMFKRMFTWAMGWKYVTFDAAGDCFLDGQIINQGQAAEGLVMNSRMVQATVDHTEQHPAWDAEANTDEFCQMVPNYAAFGLNAATINMQGGLLRRDTGESYDAGAWNPDGTMRPAHQARLRRAIETMLRNGMFPIVGLFYFRQDQILTNETAVSNAVANAQTFLEPYKEHIVIEVVNEASHGLVDHASLQEANVSGHVDTLVANGWLASHSQTPGQVPTVAEQGDGQIVFLHGNNRTPAQISSMVSSAKSTHPGKPVIFNEDGPSDSSTTYTLTEYEDHLDAAVAAGAGWGYYDQNGFQEPCSDANSGSWQCSIVDGSYPGCHWELDTAVKAGMFDHFALQTGAPGGNYLLDGGGGGGGGGPATHVSRATFNGVNATSFAHDVDTGTGPDRILIVVLRHGSSTLNITHNQVTYGGQNLTQVGDPIYDVRPSNTARRFSLWKLVDPPEGVNSLAGGFSAQVQQYSVTAIVAVGTDLEASNLAVIEQQASGTATQVAITPTQPDSLLYVTVMTTSGNTDPFAPISGTTKVEDSETDGSVTNHSFATGHSTVDAAGSAETLGFTADASDEWTALAFEVLAPPSPTATVEASAVLPTLQADVALEPSVTIDAAAVLPALSANATLDAVSVSSVNIAGSLPELSATASLAALATVIAAGTLPELEAAAGISEVGLATVSAAAVLPALEAESSLAVELPATSVTVGAVLAALMADSSFEVETPPFNYPIFVATRSREPRIRTESREP